MGKMDSNWIIDAEDFIGDMTSLFEDKNAIKKYLYQERYLGISATKGIGKTYLLQAKRRKIEDNESQYLCIPQMSRTNDKWGIDNVAVTWDEMTNYMRSVLKKELNAWISIWEYALTITCLRAMNKNGNASSIKEVTSFTKSFFASDYKENYLGEILRMLMNGISSEKEFDNLRQDIAKLKSIMYSHKFYEKYKKIAIFIDKIEQSYKLDIANKNECVNAEDDLFFWHYFQIALACAAKRMNTDKVLVFYTIREEAVSMLGKCLGQNFKKIQNSILQLNYTKEEQEKIFNKYISTEDDSFLFDASQKHFNYSYAFLGIKSLKHPFIAKSESLFDSIYRHSFDRPRDVQRFGKQLSDKISKLKSLDNNESREDLVKSSILDTSTLNTKEYMQEKKDFLPRYWTSEKNRNNFLRLLTSNIFTVEYAQKICSHINNKKCNGECFAFKCAKHPFSVFYSMGLVGIVVQNMNHYKIKFANANDAKIIRDECILPVYNKQTILCLHPALTKYIDTMNNFPLMHTTKVIIAKNMKLSQEDVEGIRADLIENNVLEKLDNRIDSLSMEKSSPNQSSKSHKKTKNVLIIVATQKEEAAVIEADNSFKLKQIEGYSYYVKNIKNINIILIRTYKSGELATGIDGQFFVQRFQPCLIAMVGFCAGKSSKVVLGDIIIPSHIYNYNLGAITDGNLQPEQSVFNLPSNFLKQISNLIKDYKGQKDISCPLDYQLQMFNFLKHFNKKQIISLEEIYDENMFPDWEYLIEDVLEKKYIKILNDSSISITANGRKQVVKNAVKFPQGYIPKEPSFKIAIMATGANVQKDNEIFATLEKRDRKTVALDMEGHAVFNLGEINGIKSIVVKGVADFANNQKDFANRYINYCTYTSYRFIEDNISNLID